MIKNIKDTMEGLGYTNIEGMETFRLQVDEMEIGKDSPLYEKIKNVYGDESDNTFLNASDCYGDKDGNQTVLIQLDDGENLFFAGNQEEYDQVSK